MMLEGAGFEIIDLGTDVPPEKFVAAVQREQADIIAMSALLTTTMPNMAHVISALETADLRQSVKVMVGGAPITQTLPKASAPMAMRPMPAGPHPGSILLGSV